MPYQVQLPDGTFALIDDSVPKDKALELAKKNFPDAFPPPPGVVSQIAGIPKEFVKGAASGIVQSIGGLGALPYAGARYFMPELAPFPETAFGKAITGAEQYLAPSDEGAITQIASGLGSVGSMLGPQVAFRGLGVAGRFAGMAPRAAPAVGVAQAAGLGAEEARQRVEIARGQGVDVTPGEELAALSVGAPIGLTELLPVEKLLRGLPVDLAGKTKMGVANYLKRALAQGGIEGAQEAASGLMQDLSAKGIYNPDLKVGESILGDAALGGSVGFIAQAGLDFMFRKDVARAYQARLAQEQQAEANQKIEAERADKQEKVEQAKKGLGVSDPAILALPAPAPKVEQVAPEDPLANPVGFFSGEELTPQYLDAVNNIRKGEGKDSLSKFSIEDLADAGAPQAEIDRLLSYKTGFDGSVKLSANDVLSIAAEKNVDTSTKGFSDFLRRATGSEDIGSMSQPQLFSAFKALDGLAPSETRQILPPGTNATRFNADQYRQSLDRLGQSFPKSGTLSRDQAIRKIKEASGLSSDRDAESILQTAIKDGDLSTVSKTVYELTDPSDPESPAVRRYANKKSAEAAAERLGFDVRERSVQQIARAEEGETLPGGPDIRQGTFAIGMEPEAFEIRTQDAVLQTAPSQEEAENKVSNLQLIRAKKAEGLLKEVAKKEREMSQGVGKLESLEADGKADSLEYKKMSANISAHNRRLQNQIDDLKAQIQSYTEPLEIAPKGQKPSTKEGFTLFEEGQPIATFPTQEAAEEAAIIRLPDPALQNVAQLGPSLKGLQPKRLASMAVKELARRRGEIAPGFGVEIKGTKEEAEARLRAAGVVFKKDLVEKAEALSKSLRPVLDKMGLKDLRLNIVDAIKTNDGQSADGQYLLKIITIALDAPDPVKALRHEVIHALKELGAFTPQQWKVLENKAKSEWMEKYDISNRYSGLSRQEMLEEAISDAFADFSQTKPPAGMIGALFRKIKMFLESFGNALRGLGFNTADSVFERVEAGEIAPAEVPETGEAPAAPKYALRSPIGLYSELEKKVEDLPLNQAPADQWKNTIKSLKGVSPSEIEWSGVNDWLDLQKGKVKKEDVVSYLQQGGVKVEETVLGRKPINTEDLDAYEQEDNSWNIKRISDRSFVTNVRGFAGDPEGAIEEAARRLSEKTDETKYSQYVLPGGENYREVLLTLPNVATSPEADAAQSRLDESSLDDATRRGAQQQIDRMRREAQARVEYRSTHWDQPNVLAHIRMNDRVDADGKRVLFVEEIQSDWGQEGKKKGFGVSREKALAAVNEARDRMNEARAKGDPNWRSYLDEYNRLNAAVPKSDGVPAAPFVTTTEGWLNLALKRVMTMAVEGGYDRVAFVNGEQSAERYDLSKQVDDLRYDGTMLVALQNGRMVFSKEAKPEELPDLVGKEIAERLLQAPEMLGNGYRRLTGLDLKVGGEGMKAFYDKIVPNAVNALLKKLKTGAELGAVQMTADPNKELDAWVPEDGEGDGSRAPVEKLTQPGFDITPAMKEKVETTGLPKFSLRRGTVKESLTPDIVAAIERTTTTRDEKSLPKKIAEAISPTNFTKYRQAFLNRYESIEQLSKKVAEMFGSRELLADTSAIAAVMFADRASGVAAQSFRKGIPVYRNGFTKVSDEDGSVKGLIQIFEPLMKYKDPFIFQTFQFYAATRRAKRLDQEGREKLFTKDEIKQGAALAEQFPEFPEVFNEYQKYNKGLVDFMKDTGVISEKEAEIWSENWDYIPFYRQMEGEETAGPNVFSSISGVMKPKKLKGGEKPIADFMETIVRNSRAAIEAGMKNVAGQKVVRDMLRTNQATIVPPKIAFDPNVSPHVISIKEEGVTKYYKVDDILLVEALRGLDFPRLPFIDILAKPAETLRNLVTKDPGFMIANLLRDSMQAWVTTGTGMIPVVDTMKQYAAALANKSPEAQALADAGLFSGYEFSGDVKAGAKAVEKELRRRGKALTPKEMAILPISKAWELLDKGSSISDVATRAEVYKRTLAETGNEAEALYQAMEVLNFGRKGNSALIRVATALIPFLNARIQGLDVLYRSGFGKSVTQNREKMQKAFISRSMALLSLSVMYWFLASDTEEYERAEQETRDNYWIVGDVRIPIPFEIGTLFKVMPERLLEYWFGQDTGSDLKKSIARNLTSTLAFNPIPQAVLPVVENVVNYSFFTGQPVVGRGMEDIEPKFQIGASTSILAQMVGEETGYSPIKIDNLIRGYTGTLGSYAAMALDYVMRGEGDPTRATLRTEQMPVFKRFFASKEATGTITSYYELKRAVDESTRTINFLERTSTEDLREYMKDKGAKLQAIKPYIQALDKDMTNLREMRRSVQISKIDPNRKAEILQNIRKAEIALTSRIQFVKKSID